MRWIRTFFVITPSAAPLELIEKRKMAFLGFTLFGKFSNAANMITLERP